MQEYDTYTFSHKSHYNEFAPDTELTFVTHQEESLDDILYMISKFLLACGYSESAIKPAMNDFDGY